MASAPSADLRSLVLELYDIGAVKVGNFTLKSGIQSPIYIDLRVTVSYPPLLGRVAAALVRAASADAVVYNVLCGVPYTALPFATIMSMNTGVPMLMRRKEAKDYGTKKIIEGHWKEGDTCLVVEDLVTSGTSVLETVQPLLGVGLKVTDVVVLLDREQGGRQNLLSKNINLHSVLSITSMLDVLVTESRIDTASANEIRQFLVMNQVAPAQSILPPSPKDPVVPTANSLKPSLKTYEQRAMESQNAWTKRILSLLSEKQTNLAVAADVTDEKSLIALAEAVGPEICVLKTHADIIDGWSDETARRLVDLARTHNFLIFEDRKFADIGNTVVRQCTGGVHKISYWADIINAHSVPGPGIIKGLAKACKDGGRELGILLLAQMSSEGNLASLLDGYTAKTVEMAKSARSIVCGFISQGKIADDDFVYMTPGVQLQSGGDSLGQQYITPDIAICEHQSDIIIVGRGVYKAEDPRTAAQEYRKAGWKAYQNLHKFEV